MALRSTRVSIDFGLGADEFTDRKLVANSNLIKAENITLNKPKTISKREGYKFSGDQTMSGLVIDPPQSLFSYQETPVILSANRVYEQIPRGENFDYFTYPKNWRDANVFNFSTAPYENAIGNIEPFSTTSPYNTDINEQGLVADCGFLVIPQEGRERRLKCTVFGSISPTNNVPVMSAEDLDKYLTVVIEDVDSNTVFLKEQIQPPSAAVDVLNISGYTDVKVIPWGGHLSVGSSPDKFIIVANAVSSKVSDFNDPLLAAPLDVFGDGEFPDYEVVPHVWVVALDSNVGYTVSYQGDFWTWAGVSDPTAIGVGDSDILFTPDPSVLYAVPPGPFLIPRTENIPRILDHFDMVVLEDGGTIVLMLGAQWLSQEHKASAVSTFLTKDTRQKFFMYEIVAGPGPTSFSGTLKGTLMTMGPRRRETLLGSRIQSSVSSFDGEATAANTDMTDDPAPVPPPFIPPQHAYGTSFLSLARQALINLQIQPTGGGNGITHFAIGTRGDFVDGTVVPNAFSTSPNPTPVNISIGPIGMYPPPVPSPFSSQLDNRDYRVVIYGRKDLDTAFRVLDDDVVLPIFQQPLWKPQPLTIDVPQWEFNQGYDLNSLSLVIPDFPNPGGGFEAYLIIYLRMPTFKTSVRGSGTSATPNELYATQIVGDPPCRTIVYFVNDIDVFNAPGAPNTCTTFRKDDLMNCRPLAHPMSGGYDDAFQEMGNGSCYRNGPSIDFQPLRDEFRYLLFPVVRKPYELSLLEDTGGTCLLMAYRVDLRPTVGGLHAFNDLVSDIGSPLTSEDLGVKKATGHSIGKALDGSAYASVRAPSSIPRYFIVPRTSSDQQGSLQFPAFGFTSRAETYISSLGFPMGLPVQGLEFENNLFTTGGFLKVFNGKDYTQNGFALFPHVLQIQSALPQYDQNGKTFDCVVTPFTRTVTEGGIKTIFYEDPSNALNPKYEFAFIYEWVDKNGLTHRSAPSQSIVLQSQTAAEPIGSDVVPVTVLVARSDVPNLALEGNITVAAGDVTPGWINVGTYITNESRTKTALVTDVQGGEIFLTYKAGSEQFVKDEVVAGGNHNSITFWVSPLDKSLSEKRGVTLKGYRSLNLSPGALTEGSAGVGGSLYHEKTIEIQDPPIQNQLDIGVVLDDGIDEMGCVKFEFNMTDAALTQRELIYTTYAEPNIAPPAISDITEHDGRLFLLGSGERNKVWYSKPIEYGYSAEYGIDHSIETFSEGGGITGISGVTNRLFLFKEESILSCVGTPLNQNARGSGYSAPISFSTTLGCTIPRSIIETEAATYFQSRNDVYSINRAFKMDKIGIEVGLSFNDPLLSAVHIPDKYEIRLCNANGMIIYNTLFKQWTTSSKKSKSTSMVIAGKQHLLDADDPGSGYIGQHMVETDDYYGDGSQPVLVDIESSWIKMTTPQGYQRIKEILLLGTLHENTEFSLELFSNYKEYPDEAVSISSADISGLFAYGGGAAYGSPAYYGGTDPDNIYQFRHKPKVQKCEALKVKIKEVPVGSTLTQGFSLNNFLLEVAGKKGAMKLPSTKTV